MEFQDYYEVLGVSREAPVDEIKKAYRRQALKWHPDRHPGAEREEAEKHFKRVNEAWEVLSDPEKRARYDRFGRNWQQGQDFRPPPGQRTMSREEFERAFGGEAGFSDFFTEMFGDLLRRDFEGRGARHARYRFRGSDVRADLSLPLGQALRGGTKSFEVPTTESCPRCGGVGRVEQHVCPTCAGVGSVHRRRRVDLKIPASVRDGLVMRLKGLGQPGDGGGEAGDLLLTLRLEDDDTYRRRGADIEGDVPLAPWEAVQGGKVDVRTARGVATVTVPPGTRAGAKLRLRGQGLDDGRGGRGDFVAVVRLVLPERLDARQRELLRELGQSAARVAGGAREGSR